MFWDVPGWDGDSRRDVNRYSGAPSEVVVIPDGAGYLVKAFWDLRGFLSESTDAVVPGLVNQWLAWSGISLSRREEGILYAMDRAFRKAMPEAIKYHEARRERKRKMEQGK